MSGNLVDLGQLAGQSCTTEQLDEPGRAASDATDRPASLLLADHTTLHVGGPADDWVVATTQAELVAAVTAADRAGTPVLVLSGGSNLVVGDGGFAGTVVQVATSGFTADVSDCGGALVTVEAGQDWDGFVAHAVAQSWVGIEALSGIPGAVGSTPIQNVSAYGQEVSATIVRVRTLDRATGEFKTFMVDQCEFDYRHSRFKAEPDRYVVLQVVFQFTLGDLSAPIRYAELARFLGVEVGQRAPMDQVRQAVLTIRAGKGMVVDAEDHDTWSAGSFFTNPLLSPEQAATLPEQAPRYVQPDQRVKTSAAWLIEQAGFGKGYGSGPATLSTKHTLAITNRGQATAADVMALAREVRDGVEQVFGVRLVNEPVLVNCALG